MPGVTLPSVGRREFLGTIVGSVGALLALDARSWAQEGESAHWAFLSDTHIPQHRENGHRNQLPHDHLEAIIPQLLATNPAGVVISGDLVRLEGFAEDYAELKRLLQPVMEQLPICMCLGNHDDRAHFKAHFDDFPGEVQPVNSKHVLAVETQPVRLLLLDSLLYTNRVAGLLGQEQRKWLQTYLEQSDDKPTLLIFHHTLGDGDGELLDTDKLFEIIAPHRQVKALIFGHSHVYNYQEQDGIHLINLPAVGYNFRDADAIGWVEARMTAQGGEFTLHAVAGNRADDGKTTSLTWRS